MAKEKLRATDCDLQVTNAQTKEEYTDDDSSIPKGSSVIVRRVPASTVKSSSGAINSERSNGYNYTHGFFKSPMDDHRTSGVMPLFSEMTNLASADVSEDNKIEAMITQSRYDGGNYKMYGASLPANYMCYRCGSKDHHIRNCPVKQDKTSDPPLRIKKSTGIPRSFMVHVDDPSIKGAMLTNSGHYAIPAIDAEAYATKKKKTSTQEQPSQDSVENPTPNELLCLICQDLLDDAVVIPCCGNSYCDDCIRTTLLDSDDHVCPTCNQLDVSPDTLIANKFLRQAVNNFKKEQSYTQSFKKPCSTSQSQESTPRPSPAPTPPPPSQPEKSQVARSPTVTCSDSTPNSPSTSQVVEKVPDETPEIEDEMKTESSLATTTSVLVSDADSESHSQPFPLVNSVIQITRDNASSGSASQSEQTSCYDRSTSTSPSEGWTRINTHHPTSSSLPFSLTQSPDITASHLQTYASVQQQPLSCYPPGFSTNTPPWTPGPSSQGAPIPSFTSSIPPLVPKEWFTFSRRNKERTPPRAPIYSSSTHLSSRSQKPKSSHSSSRSPPRSRSHSRTRPHSPPSSHRSLSSRCHSSHSYSYEYKRSHSPTQTSSSSPRSHHHSRSRSPSDHHKDHHQHRPHHSKKSTSSNSSSSRRRGESSHTSRDNSEWSLDTYLRWKQEYKDWCEKYFSSYISHFHQMPPPALMPPHWPSPSPPSSNSNSSTSQSYSESSSSTSHMSSSSNSSTTHSDSQSTTTQLSSDATSPPSESYSGTSQEPTKVSQQRNSEKQSKEGKSRKQKNEKCDLHKSSSTKEDHLKSKSYERKRKDTKQLDKEKRQKRSEKDEKCYKAKASQKTADIDSDRSRQPGHSKSQDSRSDKSTKRKDEEAQRNQRVNILTEPSPSVDLFPKLFEREKQKKAVWKPQAVTVEDVWEGEVKVKPQKKISININLDPKKNEHANQQEAEAKSSSEYFDCDKEEEMFPSQTDSETKFKIGEETRDDKNDSWDICAEDEMVTAGEDSDLWQCALTSVEQEEDDEEEEVKLDCEQKDDHNERPNVTIDISCTLGRPESVSCENDQKTTLEEYVDRRSLEKRSDLRQLKHSRWETNAPEEEQLAKVHSNDRNMKGRSKRSRLVEIDDDEDDDSTSLDRGVAPSSGQGITDSSSDFDRKRKKGTVREKERSKEEERGHHPERETLSSFYSKSSSAASHAFTSTLEEQVHSRERRPRQIYMELDIECRGKSVKSYDHKHNQDQTLNQYSSSTLHSQSHSRGSGQLPKTSREDSPRQNWTCRSQHPATPTAQSSLDMVLGTKNKKERIRSERREERMQDRQTRDSKGHADSERPSCSTKVSHDDDFKNEWRKDKKKQKTEKKEKKHTALDEKKKCTKKKNKAERREDSSKEYILDKYS